MRDEYGDGGPNLGIRTARDAKLGKVCQDEKCIGQGEETSRERKKIGWRFKSIMDEGEKENLRWEGISEKMFETEAEVEGYFVKIFIVLRKLNAMWQKTEEIHISQNLYILLETWCINLCTS